MSNWPFCNTSHSNRHKEWIFRNKMPFRLDNTSDQKLQYVFFIITFDERTHVTTNYTFKVSKGFATNHIVDLCYDK